MFIHFIGIGGISMKALAQLMLKLNHVVSGSDISKKEIEYLKSIGINAYVGVDESIVKMADMVVYTSAINNDNLELQYARKNKIKCISRAELIRDLENLVKKTIYISGCHGKSTVTGLICNAFNEEKYGFIGLCGADYIDRESNLIYTGCEYIVSEACEYKKNFLKFSPTCLVVLNIEYDHPDTYKDIFEVYNAFYKLAKKTKKLVIVNENISQLFKDINAKVISFGFDKSSDYHIEDFNQSKDGISFKIYYQNEQLALINSKLFGKFNALNILASYIVCKEYNMSNSSIIASISNFKGIKRRFQKLSDNVIIDYAHHPKEIESTINLAKSLYKDNLIIIFEPHTYSRTIKLYDDFYNVFLKYDDVIFLKTYAARESLVEEDPIVKLKQKINNNTHKYFNTYEDAFLYLNKINNRKKTFLILGAGDVYKLGYMLAKNMDNMV